MHVALALVPHKSRGYSLPVPLNSPALGLSLPFQLSAVTWFNIRTVVLEPTMCSNPIVGAWLMRTTTLCRSISSPIGNILSKSEEPTTAHSESPNGNLGSWPHPRFFWNASGGSGGERGERDERGEWGGDEGWVQRGPTTRAVNMTAPMRTQLIPNSIK